LTKFILFIGDEDGNGTLSFNEFIKLFDLLQQVPENPQILLRTVFDRLDSDKNDKLDLNEMMRFVNEFYLVLTMKDVEDNLLDPDLMVIFDLKIFSVDKIINFT
jgi:Ca2+-binding EF-hand superfamily protein